MTGVSDLTTAFPLQRGGAEPPAAPAPPALVRATGPSAPVRPCAVAQGRLRAAELLRVDPDQSLRRVAARAGVAVGTVRDVRERVRRGLHPVPDHVRAAGGDEAEADGWLEGRRGSGRDPGYVLASLRRDPSLRLSEDGRRLLGLLAGRVVVDTAIDDVLGAVPAHCAEAVAELMRHTADEWLRLAREVEQGAAGAGAAGTTGAARAAAVEEGTGT